MKKLEDRVIEKMDSVSEYIINTFGFGIDLHDTEFKNYIVSELKQDEIEYLAIEMIISLLNGAMNDLTKKIAKSENELIN